jgi:hypothetical protein
VLNHTQERIPYTYDVHDHIEEKHEALKKWAAQLNQPSAGSPSDGADVAESDASTDPE